MDASAMNPATAQAFEAMMQQKQMKDFMNLYTNLVERCFNTCCNDFTSKALSSKEDACISTCADKFLKHSEVCQQYAVKDRYPSGPFTDHVPFSFLQRVGLRFSEMNAQMMAKR